MSSWFEKIKATPLRWQFAALLVATQITAQVVTMSFTDSLSGVFGLGRESFAADALAPFTTTISIAEGVQSDGRDAVLNAAVQADSRLSLQRNVPFTLVQTDIYSKAVLKLVQARLQNDPKRTILILPRSEKGFLPAPFLVDAAYSVDGKKWLVFSAGRNSSLQSIPIMVGALTIALMAFPLAFIAIWIGSALVAPMTALATGAERFSRNLGGLDIAETGPKEVRALAGSFNAMRARISKLVDDRSQMLAAVSHDMRTPLTRLRLRIESIKDADAREAMIDEIKRIDGMINSALTFLRTQKETIKLSRIDVAVLARTICDEHSDMGDPVLFTGISRVTAYCDKELIRRAIENLVQNAVTHGGNTEVSVNESGGFVYIVVADDGDGFGGKDPANLMEPFTKGNEARNIETASKGFGLGLAITKSIAELHAGSLQIEANQPNGVLAQIVLPGVARDTLSNGIPKSGRPEPEPKVSTSSRTTMEHPL